MLFWPTMTARTCLHCGGIHRNARAVPTAVDHCQTVSARAAIVVTKSDNTTRWDFQFIACLPSVRDASRRAKLFQVSQLNTPSAIVPASSPEGGWPPTDI